MKWMPIAFLLILLAGLSLRVPQLDHRPMHHDEANQAYRFGQLLEEGTYVYDAEDHHGPTLYYLTLPMAWITGAKTFGETTEYTYRLLPVLFGMMLILCTPLLRTGMGCVAVLGASLLTAVSPAMAYYSRFYIQEMSLVFFTYIMVAGCWHSWRTGSRSWAVVAGLAAGLMFATKETAVIAFAAQAGAVFLCALISHARHFPLKNIIIGAVFAVLVSIVLFSSFFTHPAGPLESILAFKTYFARGAGVNTEHIHPFGFYLKMLTYYRFDGGPVWSEGLVLGFGLVGCAAIGTKKLPAYCDLGLARFILFYTLLLTLAYSAISYKTPWCILSLLHGWILLGGIGIAAVASFIKRPLHGVILVLVLALPVYATYALANRTVFRYGADHRNPYCYAHTGPDFKNLVKRISELEAVSPKGKELYIQVVADPDSTWPLPFYLRNYPNVGYWVDEERVPVKPKPDIILSGPGFEADADDFLTEFYGLRPDTLLAIHIDRDLWNAFIETRR